MTKHHLSCMRGMTSIGLGVTIAVLGLAGFGAWYAYCYYDVLERENAADKALEGVGLFRDGKPTVTRIRDKALDKIRAKGGTASPGDVRVHVEPLTRASAARLPEYWRQKLNAACLVHAAKTGSGGGNRMERARLVTEALARAQAGPGIPGAPPQARLLGGQACTAEVLEELGYTFVHVDAKVKVKRGLVSRSVGVEHVFFSSGPIPDDRPGAKKPKKDDDGDDE